jgi:hypothetical protein
MPDHGRGAAPHYLDVLLAANQPVALRHGAMVLGRCSSISRARSVESMNLERAASSVPGKQATHIYGVLADDVVSCAVRWLCCELRG